jgi:hypothetical protein
MAGFPSMCRSSVRSGQIGKYSDDDQHQPTSADGVIIFQHRRHVGHAVLEQVEAAAAITTAEGSCCGTDSAPSTSIPMRLGNVDQIASSTAFLDIGLVTV